MTRFRSYSNEELMNVGDLASNFADAFDVLAELLERFRNGRAELAEPIEEGSCIVFASDFDDERELEVRCPKCEHDFHETFWIKDFVN